ncbi:unnamed protein product [Rotaria sp. Silwood2]|nr:unnamed protein product [Rotaria sp. Silwood2]
MVRTDHYAVCNAVGAALCSVSASIDAIIHLPPSSIDYGKQRKDVLDQLILKVHEKCEQNGACSNTIHLTDLEQIPLAYHPKLSTTKKYYQYIITNNKRNFSLLSYFFVL